MSNDDSGVQPPPQEEPSPPAAAPPEQPPAPPTQPAPEQRPVAQPLQTGQMPPPPGTPSGPPPGTYQPGTFQAPQQVQATQSNDAMIALISGIVGLFFCGPLAFVAIWIGNRVRKDDTDPQQTLGTIGFWIGVATVALWVLAIIAWFILIVAVGTTASVSTG